MITLNFTPRKFVFLSFLIALILFGLDFILYYDILPKGEYLSDYYDEYLSITYETNIPTFFSVFVSLFTALIAYILYKNEKKIGWLVATFFFAWMGFDDGLQLHEYIGSYLGDLFLEDGFISYYWQVFFDPVFAILGLYLFYFLLQMFHEKKCFVCTFMIIAGFGFYAIAVFLDYYEGTKPNLDMWLYRYHIHYRDAIHFMRAVEEMIEMWGAILIAGALLNIHKIRVTIQ